MQKITKKLIDKMLKDFEPVAESMANGGADQDAIVRQFQKHIEKKQEEYYGKNQMESIKLVLSKALTALKNKTSKAETIFINLLDINHIKYKYQFKIGSYHADFLFGDFLVLEIDGPHHHNQKIRDNGKDDYLTKMGYKVMRVPLDVLFHSPQAVIEEIQGLTK